MARNKCGNNISEIYQSFKSVIQTNYDIIKVHGGELSVESKEGEGAEFIIQLPIKDNFK